ncbi:MAG: hypothetical protein U0271_28430 [Polyangiaceae bacterium]
MAMGTVRVRHAPHTFTSLYSRFFFFRLLRCTPQLSSCRGARGTGASRSVRVFLGEHHVNSLKPLFASAAALLALSPVALFAQAAPSTPAPEQAAPQQQAPEQAASSQQADKEKSTDATPVSGTVGATTGVAAQPVAGQPAPDTATAPPAKEESPVPSALEPRRFRNSTLTYTNSASTTLVGVGRDNIGHEDDFYGMDLVFNPSYFMVDEEIHRLFISAELGMTVEITDASNTLTRQEPQWRDTQLMLGYDAAVFTSADREWATRLQLRVRGIFPTSPISSAQGKYVTTALGAGFSQQIKLLGNEAVGLNNLTLSGTATWAHLFSRSFNPTNPDLERVRMTASSVGPDDQLSFYSFDIDRLTLSLTGTIPIVGDLSFSTQWRLISRWRHEWEGTNCDFTVDGVCQHAETPDNTATYLTNSSVDFSLSQGIYDVLSLTIGYNNENLTLGEDGKNRNILYSPAAQFYVDLTMYLDEVYSKALDASTSSNKKPAVAVGSPFRTY